MKNCENCKHYIFSDRKCTKHGNKVPPSTLCTGWQDENSVECYECGEEINKSTQGFYIDNNQVCEECYANSCKFSNETDKSKLHAEICEQLNSIYIKKNADYGDSFANARKEIKEYTLGKLYEKYQRFKKLSRAGNQVEDETIEDALMDLANYAIMELVERRISHE